MKKRPQLRAFFLVFMAVAVTIVSTAMIPSITTVIAMIVLVMAAITSVLAILRGIDIVVPVVLHEVDRRAAGPILTAMLAPVPSMAWRHMQVQRLPDYLDLLDDHGLAIDQCRTRILIADVDLAVKSGLPDTDRDADISGKRGCCSHKQSCSQIFFHECFSGKLVYTTRRPASR